MRRGERALYREIADAAHAVAESKDYAQEYMAKRRLLDADNALGQWARESMTRAGTELLSAPLYVWACSVCRDPNYQREPRPMYYFDARYCPTCKQAQPIISYHARDIPIAP